MKWIKLTLLLFALLPIAASAQNIQRITYPKEAVKEYRVANALSFAGNGGEVVLSGDGKTGASFTVWSTAPVTLNGGFTVEKGASLHILTGNKEAVTTTTIATPTAESQFRVYPNPAGSTLIIYLPAWAGTIKKELIVSDISGRQMLRQTMQPGTTELDVSSWKRGNYLLVISASDGTQQTSRLVLQ